MADACPHLFLEKENRLNIAFLHYHLKPGGVTAVIKQQVEAVSREGEALTICGEAPTMDFPGPVRLVPGMAYDGRLQATPSPAETAHEILDAIASHWKNGCDLLHVHNPTLAKNRGFLRILRRLQSAGMPLLLQIHDFAEDGRPGVYSHEPYPDDCHYAVLNTRDRAFLLHAGLKPEGVHILPNAVAPLHAAAPARAEADKVLYPVRAIRRKNLGEAILISLFLKSRLPLYITLPPNSIRDATAYENWKTFVAGQGLKVVFDAGLKNPLPMLMRSAAFVLTTSVTEGFGFTFLEPWTAGKGVWGRNLPAITVDFVKQGMALEHLYAALNIPLACLDADAFFEKWRGCVHAQYAFFGLAAENDRRIQTFIRQRRRNGCIDFGFLDEKDQQQVIRHLIHSANARQQILRLNPFLARPEKAAADQWRIERNRRTVCNAYSPVQLARRLKAVYRQVAAHPLRQSIDRRRLLDCFLKPAEMRLLKWGP